MKNALIILFLILIALCSCLNMADNKGQAKITTTEKETLIDANAYAFKENKIEFDEANFKRLADSLLAVIQNTQLTFHLTTDTLQLIKLSANELKNMPTGYLVKNSERCIKYRFEPESPNKDLSMEIVLSLFNSINATDMIFKHVKYLANEDKVSDNGVPGLTYTNDYVFKQSLKIYWLNTGCKYSFENHKKFASFLIRSLNEQTVIESIWCQCGAVNCK